MEIGPGLTPMMPHREDMVFIERAAKDDLIEGWRPTLTQPDMPGPNNELPQNVPAHMKLMLDLTVLAFQMDKTRIATLMLNNDLSQMNFKFLDGVHGALHLDLAHNGRAAEKEAMDLKTNQFHIEQFAYLTQRMKDIQEGDVRRRCPQRRAVAGDDHRKVCSLHLSLMDRMGVRLNQCGDATTRLAELG